MDLFNNNLQPNNPYPDDNDKWNTISSEVDKRAYKYLVLKGVLWGVMFLVAVVALAWVFKNGSSPSAVVVEAGEASTYQVTPISPEDTQEPSADFAFNDGGSRESNPTKEDLTNPDNQDPDSSASDGVEAPAKNSELNAHQPSVHNTTPQKQDTLDWNSSLESSNHKSSSSLSSRSSDSAGSTDTGNGTVEAPPSDLGAQAQNQEKSSQSLHAHKDEPVSQSASSTLERIIRHNSKNYSPAVSAAQRDASQSRGAKKYLLSERQANTLVWLVSIYSATSLEAAQNYWDRVSHQKTALFRGKQAYFLRADLPGKGVFFRVSIGAKKASSAKVVYPSFASLEEANSYCRYLKGKKVGCFVIKIKQSELGGSK